MTGRNIADTQDHIAETALEETTTHLVPPGSVLLVVRSGILVHTIPVAISRVPLTLNQDMKALIPIDGSINGDFLAYFLQSCSGTLLSNYVKRGATVHSIDVGRLREMPVPTPAPSEQRRIVEILDRADEVRRKRAEADQKAERILPAIFYRMFGDPTINRSGWTQDQLGNLLHEGKAALQSGPFGTHLHNSDFVEEGSILAVGIDNVHDTGFRIGRNRRITEEKYEELKKFTLEPGNVLITIMGTVGRTCVFPAWAGRAICTKHVYRIQTDRNRLDPDFLSSSIRFCPAVRVQLGQSVTGQIVDGITSKVLEDLKLEIPPLPLQEKFVRLKQSLDLDFKRRTKAGEKVERLFQSLLHRAFSGDLTAKWRQAHMKELLQEMEAQARALATTDTNDTPALDLITEPALGKNAARRARPC